MSWWDLFRQLVHDAPSYSPQANRPLNPLSRWKSRLVGQQNRHNNAGRNAALTKSRIHAAARDYWQRSSGWPYTSSKAD